ncbi:MAG TPA: hypothetical protein VK540_02910 [Polyangiaceae bacterium]|nr:hypothetical protein [Polyangiaceae bacterium]
MSRLPLWNVVRILAKRAPWLGLLPCAMSGCVDPRADYEDFGRRPLAEREAGAVDVGQSPCQEVLKGNLDGKFFGSCFVMVTGQPFFLSVDQAVRPSADGMTGEIDISFAALTLKATTMADTAGEVTVLKPTPVDAECRFRQDIGTLTLPAAANSLGTDLVSENVVLRSKILSVDRTCAELDGRVPFAGLSLDSDGDICIYVRAPADGSLPTVPTEEHVCDPSILLPR